MRKASLRVIAERLLTFELQWLQKRALSLPRIFSQSSEQGVRTSILSRKLFFDTKLSSNARKITLPALVFFIRQIVFDLFQRDVSRVFIFVACELSTLMRRDFHSVAPRENF
jgi:hypothetical protein